MSNTTPTVVPSLPAQSWSEIEQLAASLTGVAPELQIDIVDGQFVQATSWPFTSEHPEVLLSQLSQLTKDFAIEVDCMVMHPEYYLDTLVEAGVQRVTVHLGSTEKYVEIAAHAHQHGYQLGLAFTNNAPLVAIAHKLHLVDFVQVMGIETVGQQGQPFDDRTLTTIQALSAQFPKLEIAVDGSVNAQTIPDLVAAGATRLAPGSAIAKTEDPAAAYKALSQLAQGG